jgi:hypothetical protein
MYPPGNGIRHDPRERLIPPSTLVYWQPSMNSGFEQAQWLMPEESGSYQPIVTSEILKPV